MIDEHTILWIIIGLICMLTIEVTLKVKGIKFDKELMYLQRLTSLALWPIYFVVLPFVLGYLAAIWLLKHFDPIMEKVTDKIASWFKND